jgi:hypothetical protein
MDWLTEFLLAVVVVGLGALGLLSEAPVHLFVGHIFLLCMQARRRENERQ